jgi:hypothetical protein
MRYRLKLAVENFNEFALEIEEACVFYESGYNQCWCIGLKVHWQTASIKGWGFLSGRWGELLFERAPTFPPPHFISGVPIETDWENDLLWEFAEDAGACPQDLSVSIFKALGEVMFVMPPFWIVNEGFIADAAMGYRYKNETHRIALGG